MKKKIIAIVLVASMLIANFMVIVQAAGEWWERTGGSDLKNKAIKIIDNETYADSKYNAKTNTVPFTDIEIYDYGTYGKTNSVKEGTGDLTPIDYTSENHYKYYWHVRPLVVDEKEYEDLFYAIQIPQSVTSVPKVATIVYKGGITYNGDKYDVVVNINEITKTDDDSAQVIFRAGEREKISTDKTITNSYVGGNSPQIGVLETNAKVQVNLTYSIHDPATGEKTAISGLFGLTDIDCNQGVFIDDYIVDDNIYMRNEAITQNNLKYKTVNNGTYIYNGIINYDNKDIYDTSADTAYALIQNKDSIGVQFTFEKTYALSSMQFKDYLNGYYKIETKVTPADKAYIDPDIDMIKNGDSNTITFKPNDEYSDRLYLKSIKVDGKSQPIQKDGEDITSHEFKDINSNHKIAVVYGEIYNITYILNGGTNSTYNPSTYKSEDDDITFQNPTREGYDFLGWYTTPEFLLGTEKPGIASGSQGDVTVYAKWKAKKDTLYKVEHYKENKEGKYELVLTDKLTADTDSRVEAVPHDFQGYKENTTIEDRIPTGIVKADGSLVLKLYYDRKDYTVTFEPKNDTTIDNQIVKYLEKATEPTKPTKDGYTFEYWYFLDENLKPVEYDFDNRVNRDIDLIAKWKEIDVTPTPTPTPSSTTPTTPKQDSTTANKELSNTGSELLLLPIAGIVLIVGIIFGKKYNNLKRDIK